MSNPPVMKDTMNERIDQSRRNVLRAAAAGAGTLAMAGGVWALWPARQFDFTLMERPSGFRRIARSDGLSAGRLLVGIDNAAPRAAPLTDAQICNLTYAGHPTGPGRLTIAIFSDFFCPYCRILDGKVRKLAARDDRIAIVPHEVPLLGVPSQFAARAVIAAEAQGAYDAFYQRLIRTTFVPNPAYLRSIADEETLDVERFERDMRSEDTNKRLQESLALFRTFGFAGTPALAVGRTLVNGVISPADLRALVRMELAESAPSACR